MRFYSLFKCCLFLFKDIKKHLYTTSTIPQKVPLEQSEALLLNVIITIILLDLSFRCA